MGTTTSIRPGHPYGTPRGCLFEAYEDEQEREEAIWAFYARLDGLLQEVTGDPTIRYVPGTGEVVFECRGKTDDEGHCLDPMHPWKTSPDWAEIWREAGEMAESSPEDEEEEEMEFPKGIGEELKARAKQLGKVPSFEGDNGEVGDQRVSVWSLNGVMFLQDNGGCQPEGDLGPVDEAIREILDRKGK